MSEIIIKKLNVLYSKETIESRIASIASQLNERYANEQVLVLCVLKGAFMFFSDLVKHLDFRPEIDFIRISSYGDTSSSSGNISLKKDIEIDVAGKHIIIVEDIVDTGYSLKYLLDRFKNSEALSLSSVVLIDKYERREVEIEPDYKAFRTESGFIVGYGLDFAERYRELPDIYLAELEE